METTLTLAETRVWGLAALGVFLGGALAIDAFVRWLGKPPPRCSLEVHWGTSTYRCLYFHGHAGRCVADWEVRQ